MSDADRPIPLQWTPELVERFWNFESTRPEHYFTNIFGAAVVVELGPVLRAQRRILDYGCGAGFLIGHLLGDRREVTGVDFSPASVAEVERRFAGRAGFAGAHLPDDVDSTTFDVVVCCEVVEHLDDVALDETLDRLRSLVRPGGSVVITTPNEEDLSLSEVYCPVSNVVFHRWQHVRSWDASSLAAVLRHHGLTPVDVRSLSFGRTRRTNKRAWATDRARAVVGRAPASPHLLAVATR